MSTMAMPAPITIPTIWREVEEQEEQEEEEMLR